MSVATDFFKEITNFDIELYFNNYIGFVQIDYPRIIDYYNGQDIDKDAFNNFDLLVKDSNTIEELIILHSLRFQNTIFWELFDIFSDTQIKLDTVKNTGKWQRSSRTDRYTSDIKVKYIQKQLESLEEISRKSGSVNSENDWSNIALQNDLNEEKYTSAGGSILDLKLNNNANFTFKNIVDYLSGDNLYGKDLVTQYELSDSDSDLVVISGLEAFEQVFATILNTQKGSIPEFPEDGIRNDLIGSNANILSYPSLFRDVFRMMQKDDRFEDLKLIGLTKEEDKVFISLQTQAKFGKQLSANLML